MEHFVLIDGNSLVNRAFFATPVFTTSSGTPTNGIFGFLKLLLKIIVDLKPKYVTVAFDLHAPTFRHKLSKDYKATRKPMPEELAVQIPLLKETLSSMGISMVELTGYEADDLIGTLAKRFPVHTVIYTGDRDSYQLVDETTDVYFTKRGVTDLLKLTHENFKEIVGLVPKQIIDLKSLMGDSSDNIPGVPGVGEKTAMKMLTDFSSLEGVYEHLDAFTPTMRKKLEAGKESAFLSKTLATIDTAVPVDFALEQAEISYPFPAKAKEMFSRLEFRTMMEMDIFEAKTAQSAQKERLKPIVLSSLKKLESLSEKASKPCFWLDSDFHFCFDGQEVLLPVKKDLVGEGLPIEECVQGVGELLNGEKTVVFYDYKAQKHLLNKLGVTISCPFEDACMLRYLVDSNGGNGTLEEYMSLKIIPKEYPASALSELFEEYLQRADETTLKLYREIELPLSEVLYDMEEVGVRIDTDQLEVFAKQYASEMKSLEEKIYALAGEKFNLKSPMQLGVILFEKLKLPAPKKTKKGGYTTNQEVLEKLTDYEIVRLVQDYRLKQKLYSTYIEGFRPYVGSDGRVHTTYNQLLTTTGRLSSSNPNLQNIPTRNEMGKELRKMFLPSKGHVFLDADYSQIELRLLAHCSGCKELIDAYREGKDIHATTASQVFGVPLEEVTPEQRRQAKVVNFGIIYGISAFSLSQDLHITTKEAQAIIDKYFASYSSIDAFLKGSVAFAREHGYVTTILGRKRYLPEIKSSSFLQRSFGERAAMNMPLQGTSADIIKIAMLRVAKRLKEEGLSSKLILQVHDELIIDTLLPEKERVAEILQTEMEGALSLSVPLVAEVEEGENWYEAK